MSFKIGAEDRHKNQETMTQWLATETVETGKEIFRSLGIEVI